MRPPEQLLAKDPDDFTPEEQALFEEFVRGFFEALRESARDETSE